MCTYLKLNEVEGLLIRAINSTWSEYKDTYRFSYNTRGEKMCNDCGKLVVNKPYLTLTYNEGICIECILKRLVVTNKKVWTKQEFDIFLAGIKKEVTAIKKQIKDIGKANSIEESTIKKYQNKIDPIHRGVTIILATLREGKCTVCKGVIPMNDTCVSAKKRTFKTRRNYNIKVCLECYLSSTKEAMVENNRILNEVIKLFND